MPTLRVVPAFDEVEECQAGFGRRREARPVEQLTFRRRKEAFAQCVVLGVTHRTHRGANAHHATAPRVEDDGQVRNPAPVGMYG